MGEREKSFGIVGGKVGASCAGGNTETFVPIGAVQCVGLLEVLNEHDLADPKRGGSAWVWRKCRIPLFPIDGKRTKGCRVVADISFASVNAASSGRMQGGENRTQSLVSDQRSLQRGYVNPRLVVSDSFRSVVDQIHFTDLVSEYPMRIITEFSVLPTSDSLRLWCQPHEVACGERLPRRNHFSVLQGKAGGWGSTGPSEVRQQFPCDRNAAKRCGFIDEHAVGGHGGKVIGQQVPASLIFECSCEGEHGAMRKFSTHESVGCVWACLSVEKKVRDGFDVRRGMRVYEVFEGAGPIA